MTLLYLDIGVLSRHFLSFAGNSLATAFCFGGPDANLGGFSPKFFQKR